jgi:hypothetical protein
MDTDIGRYILEGKVPVPCEDLLTWAQWVEEPKNRIVKQEYVGELWVSTVFLALDHDFLRDGPPLLFETMVFRDSTEADQKEMDQVAERLGLEKIPSPRHIAIDYAERTATWELALEAHAEGKAWAKRQLH